MAFRVSDGSLLARIVVDRSPTEALLAGSVAWLAFLVALPVFEPGMSLSSEMAIAAAGAAGLVVLGFAAASRVRPMWTRRGGERLRLLGWSLSLGALMGMINLGVNLGLASLDPTLASLLAERFVELSPWTSVLAAPVIEEIVFRLFLLSAVAMVIARFTEDRGVVFWTALVISGLVFGLMHVLRPEPASTALAWTYRSGVTLKSTAGGFLLGWIYWRWGLGYSVACHSAINGSHLLLEPLVF